MTSRFWRWFYDRAAFAYDGVLAIADVLRLGSEGHIRRELIAKLELLPGTRVADLGCGTAANGRSLPRDIVYVGVDISRGMLERAAAKHNSAILVQADASAIPFEAGTFDLVIAMGVMQHVHAIEDCVASALRMSKRGGRILIIDEKPSEARIRKALERDNVLSNAIGEYFVLDFLV